jgi:hypothetical protein
MISESLSGQTPLSLGFPRSPVQPLSKYLITKFIQQIIDQMRLQDHDLIPILVFNDPTTQIVVETIFKLVIEAIFL